MRRPHPDLVVLLVAVLGVIALDALARGLEPPVVPPSDLPRHEGGRVALDARVVDVRHGARGRFLVLAADGHRVPALAGVGDGPLRGDEVRAVGVVTRVDASLGLSLERLDVLRPAGARVLRPGDLAARPADHDGARVAVEGELRGEWLVGGGARVRLGGEPPPARDGWWLAVGRFGYDDRTASFVLRVEAWTRA